jgi:hypothetical protein
MTPADVERYYADVHGFYQALPADRYPVLASIATDMTGHDRAERFRFGLDVILSGLEAASGGSGRAEPR